MAETHLYAFSLLSTAGNMCAFVRARRVAFGLAVRSLVCALGFEFAGLKFDSVVLRSFSQISPL